MAAGPRSSVVDPPLFPSPPCSLACRTHPPVSLCFNLMADFRSTIYLQSTSSVFSVRRRPRTHSFALVKRVPNSAERETPLLSQSIPRKPDARRARSSTSDRFGRTTAIEHALSVTNIHLKRRRESGPVLLGSMRSEGDVDTVSFLWRE